MNNKVLIKIIVPEIDESYDLFIPVNEVVWKIIKLVTKSISDLSGGDLDLEKEYMLINKETSLVYDNNAILIDTDIRNATELIMIPVIKVS